MFRVEKGNILGFQSGMTPQEAFIFHKDREPHFDLILVHELQHLLDRQFFIQHEVSVEKWEMEYLAYARVAMMIGKWHRENRQSAPGLGDVFSGEEMMQHFIHLSESEEDSQEEHVRAATQFLRDLIAEMIDEINVARQPILREDIDQMSIFKLLEFAQSMNNRYNLAIIEPGLCVRRW